MSVVELIRVTLQISLKFKFECCRCGETGHISRDCPEAGSKGRGGGGGGGGGGAARGPMKCYECGEEGHMARDCPDRYE